MTKTPEPVAHGKMRPQAGTPPGIELDGKGHVIPLKERTLDDQEKAAGGGIKDPNQEAENPAPMQRDQQGKGGLGPDRDPEGQQGGEKK